MAPVKKKVVRSKKPVCLHNFYDVISPSEFVLQTSSGATGRRASHIVRSLISLLVVTILIWVPLFSFVKSGGEESGWEDNNIFQSGAESSSPAKPTPPKPSPTRKRTSGVSVVPRQMRKSTSAPPDMVDSSPLRAGKSAYSPPQSPLRTFNPPAPYNFSPPSKLRFTPIREVSPPESLKAESQEKIEIEDTADQYMEGTDAVRPSEHEKEADDAYDRLVAETAADEFIPFEEPDSGGVLQSLGRIIVWLGIVATTYTLFSYKVESSAIGYCDRGSNTSHALDAILAKRAAIEACSREVRITPVASSNNTSQVEDDGMNTTCPLPPLFPLPHPVSCTPCPDHATCTQSSVTCDSGYLLKPHILLSFVPVSPSDSSLATTHAPQLGKSFLQAFSSLTSGFPGFGSVGLPPRCLEDPQRKRNIGALGKAIESMLGKERGRRICHGERVNATEPQTGPEAAVKWGVEVDKLRKLFRETATVS